MMLRHSCGADPHRAWRCRPRHFTSIVQSALLVSYCTSPLTHTHCWQRKTEMGDTNSTPDLQTILANLARFAPAAASHATDSVVNKDDALNPPSVGSVSNEHEAKQSARDSRDLEGSDPRFKPQTRSTASPKPVIDPATITTWQDGLRCVTKIAAQNAQFAASIRKVGDMLSVISTAI